MYTTMKKITFAILGIVLASSIAVNFGIVTVWQMLAINIAAMIILMMMVIFLVYKVRKMVQNGTPYNIPEVKVVVPKAQIDNKLILANSDILKKNIVPTSPFRSCIIRISMEINNSIEQLGISVVRLREYKTVENTIKRKFNAEGLYTIDTVARPDETINFKFDHDVDIKKLMIDELYIP